MSKREIASLAFKIMGINMVLQGFSVMISMFSVSLAQPNQLTLQNFVNAVFPFSFFMIFGVLLWFLSDKLSESMIKGKTDSNESLGIKASDLQRIAFSVLGLYFLGNSLPKLISTLINISSKEITNYIPVLILVGGPITQFIVGFAIFTGSEGLVNFLKSLRTAGIKKENDQEETKNE